MPNINKFIVIVASVVVGFICFGNYRLSKQARYWPTVTGVVVASSVYGVPGTGRGAHPDIHYQFSVNGQVYVGEKLTFGGDHSFYGRDPKPFVAQYPVGADIKVYFDPQNPQNSVLFPEHNSAGGNLILALILWLVAAVLTVSLWKKIRST